MLRKRNQQYFATHIYSAQLPSKSSKRLINDLKKEAYQIKKADSLGRAWSAQSYAFGYTSYGSTQAGFDRLHQVSSSFKDLEKQINKHIKKFIQDLDYDIAADDLKMTYCWVNIMGKNASHSAHTHPLSVISGTFYVDVPKGSSSLKFEDPRMGLFMNTPSVKSTAKPENQRYIELKPLSGYLVLFESWLKHEVPRQTCTQERISISFNYGWAT